MSLRDRFALRNVWHRHPGVRTGDQLTRGERAADTLRNVMGSWGFVFGALLFLFGWMLGNRNVGFDVYPFILLNLILSCLAAYLITARQRARKRQAIAARLAAAAAQGEREHNNRQAAARASAALTTVLPAIQPEERAPRRVA